MSIDDFTRTLNEYGAKRIPFLFLVDFEMKKPLALPLDSILPENIMYNINGRSNSINEVGRHKPLDLIKFPPDLGDYKKKFDKVWSHLVFGDSYLTNLTIKTRVHTQYSLTEIFALSHAKYKVWFQDQFLVFSPETFVRIEDGRISAYPMKGTIDADLPDAGEKILNDPKELAEHVTIVDLIRNDLSAVSDNVHVTRFRYLEEIRTVRKNLLQVSSEIQGVLPDGYERSLGDILRQLLPAGSVSGAPKCKTLEIIRMAEKEPRGYYTGVVGIFDGKILDSGVMIRFLEYDQDTLYYRSGGGITVQSAVETEYQEAIDKIYVPFD